MGFNYDVNGALKVKPGTEQAAVDFLREQVWPFEEPYVMETDTGRVILSVGGSMSYSTAGAIDDALQEAAVRYGDGASVFQTRGDEGEGEMVVGATEYERRVALHAHLDDQIEALKARQERIRSGEEKV